MISIDKAVDRTVNSLLSLVIPVYQEGNHIKSSIGIIENVLIENNIVYEFIGDDGSLDNGVSLEVLQMVMIES